MSVKKWSNLFCGRSLQCEDMLATTMVYATLCISVRVIAGAVLVRKVLFSEGKMKRVMTHPKGFR